MSRLMYSLKEKQQTLINKTIVHVVESSVVGSTAVQVLHGTTWYMIRFCTIYAR